MSLRRRFKVIKWRLKRRFDYFESRVTDLLYGNIRPTGRLWFLAVILSGFEVLFRGMVALRLQLYQWRILRQEHLGCTVVVIGNLTVGGTGKTPVVEKFARELLAKGRRVAILSRGYKRQEASWLKKLIALIDRDAHQPIVVSDGTGRIFCDWRRAGDEPYMLAQALPGAIVIVDRNRVKAGAYAIRKFKADTLILDDGFQYLPLKSRLQLVLIDQSNPFGNGSMLPRGIMREPPSALRRANYVFITKSDGAPPAPLLAQISTHAPKVSPIVCAHVPQALRPLHGNDPEKDNLPLSLLSGARVLAFSGIAVPQGFEQMLEHAGANLVKALRYADHYPYEAEDIEDILRTASSSRVDMIVTTEKDAVRLPNIQATIPIYYLRMEVEILHGAKDFSAAVNAICHIEDNK